MEEQDANFPLQTEVQRKWKDFFRMTDADY